VEIRRGRCPESDEDGPGLHVSCVVGGEHAPARVRRWWEATSAAEAGEAGVGQRRPVSGTVGCEITCTQTGPTPFWGQVAEIVDPEAGPTPLQSQVADGIHPEAGPTALGSQVATHVRPDAGPRPAGVGGEVTTTKASATEDVQSARRYPIACRFGSCCITRSVGREVGEHSFVRVNNSPRSWKECQHDGLWGGDQGDRHRQGRGAAGRQHDFRPGPRRRVRTVSKREKERRMAWRKCEAIAPVEMVCPASMYNRMDGRRDRSGGWKRRSEKITRSTTLGERFSTTIRHRYDHRNELLLLCHARR